MSAQRSGAAPRGTEWLRRRVARGILSVTAGGGVPRPEFSTPVGDPGLFGPDSVCWRVHSDFTAMMIGGIGALMMQALHPLALAGVWDHSNFRDDMLGRLRRTASFISGTTYAGREPATQLIERVRAIHRRVSGTAPGGRPYRADDPALLTWVHVSETYCFLRSYLRHVDGALPTDAQDRYFEEMTRIASALGASDVPRSLAAVEDYIEAMQPELEYSQRSRDVLRFLLRAPAPSPLAQPMVRLFVHAGIDLLPPWAQSTMGVDGHARLRHALVTPGVVATKRLFRWGLRRGAAQLARERMGVTGA